jgi:hypothetical protein
MYIHNFEPSRWPAGSPDPAVCNRLIPFGEYDSSPTKTYMIEHQYDHGVAALAELAFGKRPGEELYDLRTDPEQLNNIAGSVKYAATQQTIRRQLFDHLEKTKDPRVVGGTVDWDYYPHYGRHSNKTWKVDEKP